MPYFETPEEAQRFMEEQQDKARAENAVLKSEMQAFLSELTADQLRVLDKMISMSAGDREIGYDLTGTIRGALIFKFGMNWDGEETPWSDTSAESFSPGSDEEHAPIVPVSPVVTTEPDVDFEALRNTKPEESMEHEQKQSALEKAQARLGQMSDYNLEPHPDNEYFRCTNCLLQYISLEDRMLRPPGIEGCPGCLEKSAWG